MRILQTKKGASNFEIVAIVILVLLLVSFIIYKFLTAVKGIGT